MGNVTQEIIRLIFFDTLCLYLWYLSGKKGVRREAGWPPIFGACVIVNIGLIINITANFPSLSKFLILGNSPYQPFVKNLVVFPSAFILLMLGVARMIPATSALRDAQAALKESHMRLEKRVEERTAELRLTNEKLLHEISERKAAGEALRKARDELEYRVQERTAELETSNETLRAEISERIRIGEDLHESEERYRLLAENSVVGVYLHQDAFFVYVNRRVEEMLGYSADELTKMRFWEIFHPELQEQIKTQGLGRYRGEKVPPVYETRLMTRDGETRFVHVSAVSTPYRGKASTIGTFIDITERRRAEEELRESEERYRTLVELAPVPIHINTDGTVVFANPAAAQAMRAKSPQELVGRSVNEFLDPGLRELARLRSDWMLQEWKPAPIVEMSGLRVDGSPAWVQIHSAPIMYDGKPSIMVFALDTTERKIAEQQIKQSLREKEVMLREIHHRVKNNLQLISSMLHLQSLYAPYKSAREVVAELDRRIWSMALVHENLHRSASMVTINVANYIQSVIGPLLQSYKHHAPRVRLKVDLDQDASFSIDLAIPCGMILSELVSNSLKHAFPGDREGEIRIILRSTPEKEFELMVGDNGLGIREDPHFSDPKTLGLDIVKILADQIHAKVELNRDRGTEFRIKFREIEKRRRVPGNGGSTNPDRRR